MMNRYESHNLNIIHKGIAKFIPVMEKNSIRYIFSETAHAVFEWIDSHSLYYHDQTFNLRDSIGVGVYKDGVLQEWIHQPAAKATTDRRFSYKRYVAQINGRDLLETAISSGEDSDFAKYTMVLYAAAPYGIFVQEGGGKRGTGWWSEGLVPCVKERFLTTAAKYNAK